MEIPVALTFDDVLLRPAKFETACQNLDLPLYVLPPRRPQYNGCVERAHSKAKSSTEPGEADLRQLFFPQHSSKHPPRLSGHGYGH